MDRLLKVAIIGTAQFPGPLPDTGTEIDTLRASLPQEQRERTFLLTAGALAFYQKAGQPLRQRAYHCEQAEPEMLPVCSEQAAHLLTELLVSQNSLILQEALLRLQTIQQRIPYSLLPRFLDYGAQHKDARSLLLSLIGMRGHWLAQYNPRWSWATQKPVAISSDAETIWQEGILEQRMAVLQRVRAQEPALARSWLEASWPDEKAEVRQTLLPVLRLSLSVEDEPFLQRALNDRSSNVRAVAAELLLLLPDNLQRARLIAQMDALLTYQPENTTGALSVHLPAKFSAEVQKEIDLARTATPKTLPSELFTRALCAIPPQHWEQRFSVIPTQLIAALFGDPWEISLIQCWAQAALQYDAHTWYQPLLDWFLQQRVSRVYVQDHLLLELFLRVTPQGRDKYLQQIARTNTTLWFQLVALLPAPWPLPLSLEFIGIVREQIKSRTVPGTNEWYNAITKAALGLSLESFDAALEPWQYPEQEDYMDTNYHRAVSALLTQLQFRQRIGKEIV